MKTHLFFITAKTNLHVGDEGGAEFTIIDKSIQRDVLTELPCINSSSLKGAISEYCASKKLFDTDKRIDIFGSDKSKDGKKDTRKGNAVFFDAKILLLPVQNSHKLFNYATSQEVIDAINDRLNLFGLESMFLGSTFADREVDVKVAHKEFKDLCSDDNLPIIARNVLNDGLSANLWYEQALPAETVLYTIIREEGNDLANALNNKVIQIGANATIGYGYCQFNLIQTVEEKS